jgi:hypothetical protein
MKLKLAVSALGAFFVLAGSAEARYLPYATGYRAVLLDTIAAKEPSAGVTRTDFEGCRKTAYGRFECYAWGKGDELGNSEEGDYFGPDQHPAHIFYRHVRCDWIAAAHWRGRRVVVNRRETTCRAWEDESLDQP